MHSDILPHNSKIKTHPHSLTYHIFLYRVFHFINVSLSIFCSYLSHKNISFHWNINCVPRACIKCLSHDVLNKYLLYGGICLGSSLHILHPSTLLHKDLRITRQESLAIWTKMKNFQIKVSWTSRISILSIEKTMKIKLFYVSILNQYLLSPKSMTYCFIRHFVLFFYFPVLQKWPNRLSVSDLQKWSQQ